MNRVMKLLTGTILALSLAACGPAETSAFGVISEDADTAVSMGAEHADAGSEASGDFTVKRDETVVVKSDLTSGIVQLEIRAAGSASSKPAVSADLSGTGETEYTLAPGDYTAVFTVTEKADGTAVICLKTAEAPAEDGQNPVMNFVGTYACGRCSILVECEGSDGAKFLIQWGSSAAEHSEWTMSGVLDSDTLTVSYADAVRKDIVFKENGTIDSETTVYENGTGSFTFQEDGTLTWNDEQENAGEDMIFEYAG